MLPGISTRSWESSSFYNLRQDFMRATGRRIIIIVASKIHSRRTPITMQRLGVDMKPLYSPDQVLRFLSGNPGDSDGSPDGSRTGTTASGGIYLHVGPSGDFWTGHSIFAAKHLPPDYVKSVKLDDDMDVDGLLELLEEASDYDGTQWTRAIYDEGSFPKDLLDRLDRRQPSKE